VIESGSSGATTPRSRTGRVAGLLATAAMLGCTADMNADADLVGTRWLLRMLPGLTLTTTEERPPFLQLAEDESETGVRASGHAGCNDFSGAAEVDAASLAFGVLATTRRMCPPHAMELEASFLEMLSRVETYGIRGTRLVLSDADGELATFEAWNE